MKMLKSRLYEQELEKQKASKDGEQKKAKMVGDIKSVLTYCNLTSKLKIQEVALDIQM